MPNSFEYAGKTYTHRRAIKPHSFFELQPNGKLKVFRVNPTGRKIDVQFCSEKGTRKRKAPPSPPRLGVRQDEPSMDEMMLSECYATVQNAEAQQGRRLAPRTGSLLENQLLVARVGSMQPVEVRGVNGLFCECRDAVVFRNPPRPSTYRFHWRPRRKPSLICSAQICSNEQPHLRPRLAAPPRRLRRLALPQSGSSGSSLGSLSCELCGSSLYFGLLGGVVGPAATGGAGEAGGSTAGAGDGTTAGGWIVGGAGDWTTAAGGETTAEAGD